MKENLAGMAAIPQWFIWRLEWDAQKGKYKKTPCGPDGLTKVDHMNFANWMTFEAATDRLSQFREWTRPAGVEHALGFSLTKNSGYWFLDVDNAIADGQFNTGMAKWLYESLPGAAFEYSSSGTGFHLFGRGTVPLHGCRVTKETIAKYPEAAGLEFYTDERGIAFGMTGQMSGNADSDHSSFIYHTLVPTLFPYRHDIEGRFDELDFKNFASDERWVGPTDDDDLIRRAMQSSSTAAAFGGKACFADLFTNNREVLDRCYPGDSEIDMALIAQFAFWTGKNHQRIEKLMRRSKLVRAKWDERRGELTWLQHSIVEQCRFAMNVLQDKRLEEIGEPAQLNQSVQAPAEQSITAPAEIESDYSAAQITLLDRDNQDVFFRGCVYVMDEDAIFTPIRSGYGALLNQKRFKAMKSGKSFIMDNDNTRVTRDAWEAFLEVQFVRRPRVETTIFRPDLPARTIITDEESQRTGLNVWQPPTIRHTEGDPSWFLTLIARLLPVKADQEILIAYLAALKQYPGKKFRWCCVLQGTMGNGKSTIGEIMENIIGLQYTTRPTTKQLIGKFNSWQVNKLLGIVDDVSVNPRDKDVMEMLRPIISESRANIEGKGRDIDTKPVCINYLMSMNRKTGIMRDDNERRYAIFYTAQQCLEDILRDFPGDFFVQLRNWLDNFDGYAICAHYLQNYKIPLHLNPALNCVRAPKTSSESEIVSLNETDVSTMIREFIDSGISGFMNGWVSLSRCKDLLKEAGNRANIYEIKDALSAMGYIPHPLLGKDSRTDNGVPFENNRKIVLWVINSHPSIKMADLSNADIGRLYVSDNSGFTQ